MYDLPVLCHLVRDGVRLAVELLKDVPRGCPVRSRGLASKHLLGPLASPLCGILPDLAQVLGVTTDQLLGIKPVRSRTNKPQDTRLWRRFKQVEKLPAKERRQLLQLIDAFLEREKLRENQTGEEACQAPPLGNSSDRGART